MKKLIIIALGAQTGTDRKIKDLSQLLEQEERQFEVYNIFQPEQIKISFIRRILLHLSKIKGGRFVALMIADAYIFGRSILNKEQLSVLSSTYPLIGIFQLLNKYTRSYKYFYYVPDMMWHKEYVSNGYWKIFKFFAKASIRTCQVILVPTSSARLDILTFMPVKYHEKIKYMREYVNKTYWKELDCKNPSNNLENIKFHLFPGSLKPSKNILNTLKAFSVIQTDYTNHYFVVLFSKSNLENYLNKFTPNEIDINKLKLIYLPGVTDNELKWLYNNTKTLIIPSIEEGVGLPILEAGLYNCSIITSIISAMPETSSLNAIYVDPFDHFSIAKGIKYAIQRKEKQHISERFQYGFDDLKRLSIKDNISYFFE